MTTTSSGTVAIIQRRNREELLCALRKRHPAVLLSETELGNLLDFWLRCGAFDLIRGDSGEIEFRLRA
jgi:hypothetical protein